MDLRSVLLPALAMGTILTAASLGLGQDAERSRTGEPSAVSLVAARCTFCHGAATTLAFSRRVLDSGGPEALDLFLAGHHAPDAGARASIVDFLAHPFGDQQ